MFLLVNNYRLVDSGMHLWKKMNQIFQLEKAINSITIFYNLLIFSKNNFKNLLAFNNNNFTNLLT